MSSAARPFVIAHRGASGYRPEHTRSAFLTAIAFGTDAVEPDLVASSDGVLVIRHENEISHTTDVADHPEFADRRTTKTIDGARVGGWFTEDFTWAELTSLRCRERVPGIRPANTAFDGEERILRLEDLLAVLDDVAGRAVALVAELKHASYFRSIGLPLESLLADVLASTGWDDADHEARLTVESFELSALSSFVALPMRTTYLVEDHGSPEDDPGMPYAEFLTSDGLRGLADLVDGISVKKSLLLDPDATGTALVDRAHVSGLEIWSWTLRAENNFLVKRFRAGNDRAAFGNWRAEFEFLIGTGVDGVFADHPDLAIEVRDAFAGRETRP